MLTNFRYKKLYF